MPKIKSLLTTAKVDLAQRSHKCQANQRHILKKGEKRLKARKGRSWDHDCVACAKQILDRDRERLEALGRQVESV